MDGLIPSPGGERVLLDDLRFLTEKIRLNLATQEARARLFEEKRRLRRENEKLRNIHFITLEYESMIEKELMERIRLLSSQAAGLEGPSPGGEELELLRAENARLKLELEKLSVILDAAIGRGNEGPKGARQAEASEIAYRDPLTRLYNRRKFSEELVRAYSLMNASGSHLSLVMFDIDHLKAVNEAKGHEAGDEVLRAIARALSGALPEADVYARWGGEEFIVIEPNTDLEGASATAERLRRLIAESLPPGREAVTCSFGVIEVASYEEPQSILKRLERCVARAKAEGRDRVFAEARPERRGHYDE